MTAYFPCLERALQWNVKMYKDKVVKKNVKNSFLSMCDVKVSLIFTSMSLVLFWQLLYLFRSSIWINTVIVTAGDFERNESGRFGAWKSDSTHHFFRNACTKSGSLRFSQFSGCWLILSVYILMSFECPFVTLFGVLILFFSNLKFFPHHKLVISLKTRINSQNPAIIFNEN